ncbi:MAG TPA: hypothetical protein VJZ27_18840, partial [Aggregatilineales bacterium]|nr:hypothetical protein [Aggregatilineales bacterium]
MLRKVIVLTIVLVMIAAAIPAVTAQDTDYKFPIGEGDFTWSSLDAFQGFDMGGEDVVFFGPWLTGDEESLTNVIAYFNGAVTNGQVTYIGSDSFEQQIVIDIDSGDPPNLAAFPQPGLAGNMAARDGLVPLS